MAIRISVSNKVKFKVKGTIKDEAGIDQPFDFTLTCKRLTSEQIQSRFQLDGEIRFVEFLSDVVEDWAGVKDDEGQSVPYSVDALRELCLIPGVAAVGYHTYMSESGARAKN